MKRAPRPPTLARCAAWMLAASPWACTNPRPPEREYFPFEDVRACLFTAPQVLAGARREMFGEQPNAVVIAIGPQSSYRAVAEAVQRSRERALAVGYWIDLGAAGDTPARIDAAAALLKERTFADAVFVDGWLGATLPCGCASSLCVARGSAGKDPRDGARVLASVRGFAVGAAVVPVAQDRGGADACVEARCAEAGCARQEQLAWSLAREHAPRIALRFSAPAPGGAGALDEFGERVAQGIARRARPPPVVQPAEPLGSATVVAVFPALELSPELLERAVAGARFAKRGGWIAVHAPAETP